MGYGIYAYGITQGKNDEDLFNTLGVDETNHLEPIAVDDFYMITSPVDLDEYGEGQIEKRLEDMVWVEEKVRIHFNVTRLLAKDQTVIPMKFCTIFLNEESLKSFVSKYLNRIKEAFEYFKGKEEWTFKVFCDRKKFLDTQMEKEKDELEKQLTNTSKGAAYFMKKKLVISLEEKAREKINRIKDVLWKELSEKADKAKLNKNLSTQVTELKEEMILNTALLLACEKVTEILNWLSEKEKELENLNMYVEFKGPWPFYNFTSLFVA